MPYVCPNCKVKLKLVPQCGGVYSCAKCKEFFTTEYLKLTEESADETVCL